MRYDCSSKSLVTNFAHIGDGPSIDVSYRSHAFDANYHKGLRPGERLPQVAGAWKPVRNARGLIVDVIPLKRLTGPEQRALAETAARYGRFLDVPVSLSVA